MVLVFSSSLFQIRQFRIVAQQQGAFEYVQRTERHESLLKVQPVRDVKHNRFSAVVQASRVEDLSWVYHVCLCLRICDTVCSDHNLLCDDCLESTATNRDEKNLQTGNQGLYYFHYFAFPYCLLQIARAVEQIHPCNLNYFFFMTPLI